MTVSWRFTLEGWFTSCAVLRCFRTARRNRNAIDDWIKKLYDRIIYRYSPALARLRLFDSLERFAWPKQTDLQPSFAVFAGQNWSIKGGLNCGMQSVFSTNPSYPSDICSNKLCRLRSESFSRLTRSGRSRPILCHSNILFVSPVVKREVTLQGTECVSFY